MNAVEYLKEKARMTKKCSIDCNSCLLRNNGTARNDCDVLEENTPERAVEIVEQWAKENPGKTYLSVLLEKFPNAEINSLGTPKTCPDTLFGHKVKYDLCSCSLKCVECWNREYKEEE